MSVKKLVLVLLGLAVLVFLGVKLRGSSQKAPATTISEQSLQIEAGEHVKGNENAKVTLIEYLDYQCPNCAFYADMIDQLLKDFPDDLKVVVRVWPLTSIHKNAMTAALAAEAAGMQGKYWQMHDLLFKNQKNWSEIEDPTEVFVAYAKTLGLDEETFRKDSQSQEAKAKVEKNTALANQAGVKGLTTFFLNGKKIDSPKSYDEFKALIEVARNSQ